MEFSGKVVIVTGAFGVLGSVVAQRFARQGAKVVAVGRTAPADLDEKPFAMVLTGTDLSSFEATRRGFDAAHSSFGRIDILVNVAGGFRLDSVFDASLDAWDDMYARNLKSTVSACKAAVPHMRSGARGGRIVNVAAAAATKKATAANAAYAASKAGVLKLTEGLAAELLDLSITVNAILPSTIDTPENRRAMPGADRSSWATPESLADLILYLASERASDITGRALDIEEGTCVLHQAVGVGT